ncbi:MAG: PhnD/SsuA/transferrin family substrate-binding protein [candidate division Zixibacteria bacterium]|nr:PhnD/SsuA/transferrin family substrate-binding protein [candidate division Zixibacteria bacterium]
MKRSWTILITAVFVAILIVNLGCKRGKGVSEMEPVVVALGPTFDAAEAGKKFGPLAAYLEERLHRPFKFQPTKSREEFSSLVKEGKAAFVFASPLDYAEVADGCIVLVKANYTDKGSMAQGCIIVPEGGTQKIREVAELKGSSIMIVSKDSLDGYLSQKMFFNRNGLDLDLDFDLREAPNGTADEVIAAVAGGEVEYGCVRADLFPSRKPFKGAEALTYTEKVPVEVFAFVDVGGDRELGGRVRNALRKIPRGDAALKPLGQENFILAIPAEYDLVTQFLAQDKIDKAQRLSGTPTEVGKP